VPASFVPKVVLFDLDDTLFDHAAAARAALLGVHRGHPGFAGLGFDQFESDHAGFLEVLHQRVLAGEMGIDDARVERFRRLFMQAGVAADERLLQDTAAAYRTAYLAARQPVAGARDLLVALKPLVRIGVVSNNLLEEQRDKLRLCGFEPFVDALIVSEEAGMSKPDPAIFAIALDRLGCRPDEAVMVGDSWAADIEGARAAGIRAVWFTPRCQAVNRERPAGTRAAVHDSLPDTTPRPGADVVTLAAFVPVQAAIEIILGPGGIHSPAGAATSETRA
jgi:HAD superfamily hydrolase (TIGR01549 family)